VTAGSRSRQVAVASHVRKTDRLSRSSGSPHTLAPTRSAVVLPADVGPAKSPMKLPERKSDKIGGT
jgi:hypothetical protein